MKKNFKVIICSMIMCVVVVVSSMATFAGTASKVIGSVPAEQARCTLNAFPRQATAATIPITNYALDCYTRVLSIYVPGNYARGEGTTTATATRASGHSDALSAWSYHQAGNLYTELECDV